ncbi:aminotransferase class III-fold pyridoxal phosphate-dependent enzyme, partial [Bacillus thuringiensis]|uniref:aminotransferase class III-fold pyridoxal phosphate-dependent enzyme n=1 Tax=Bacillus thuringiensis TaxID=1428 RepID=UPI003CF4795B
MAATLISDNVMEPILNGSRVIMSGHTFSGNPMSATAALAVLKLIDSEKMIEGVGHKGTYLKNLIEKFKTEFSFVQDVRGKGLMLGIELNSLGAPFTSYIVKAGVECGILLYPAAAGIDGRKGSAIMVTPPLNSSKRELEEMVKR